VPLRLLPADPAARGHGMGARPIEARTAFARSAECTELVLLTNDVLTDARSICQRAGFELLGSPPHRGFGRDLVGQDRRPAL
jgi:GNAT superfamily N-acetyltransferase